MKRFILLFIPGIFFFVACSTMAMPGSFRDTSVADRAVISAAQFAVEAKTRRIQDEDKNNPVQLKLLKIRSAQQQVVSGMNYKLKLELSLNGQEKAAEAVVWWQAWRKPDSYTLTAWRWLEESK